MKLLTLWRGCVVRIQSSNEILAFCMSTRKVSDTCLACDV